MIDRTDLPHRVVENLNLYRASLSRHHVTVVESLHLVGSVALGDFRDDRSDIDFVALLRHDPSEAELDRLERVHDDLNLSGSAHVDGVYIASGRLRRMPIPGAELPFCVDGRFRRSAPCFEDNPAVRRCLARHGITVFGRMPDLGAVADDPQVLRSFLLDNLAGYWTRWLGDAEVSLARKAPGERVNPAAGSWGVLGVARIARTLASGEIVSKSEAGRWALATCDSRWHPVIATALAARHGRIDPLTVEATRACLDFMRRVIDAEISRSPGPPG